jgi:hypothetical protein
MVDISVFTIMDPDRFRSDVESLIDQTLWRVAPARPPCQERATSSSGW